MVQYLPSSATATINVLTSEVNTVLSLTAPTEVVQGESFRMSGELRRADNNQIMPGETITAVFNGTVLGSDITAGDGTYNIDGVIPDVGSYTLTLNFAGSIREGLTFGASKSIWNLAVGQEWVAPITIVVTATLSAILLAIGLKK